MHIPTTTVRGKVVPALPDRVVIPWKGAEGWRDEAGWGEMVLSALWGDRGGERARGEGGGDEKQRIAGVIEPEDWDILSNLGNEHKGWVFMERGMPSSSPSSTFHPQLPFLVKMTTANVMESNNNGPLGISPAQSAFSSIEQDGGLGVCDAKTGFLVDGG